MAFIVYHFLPLLLAIPLIAVVIILALALAFYKVNNRNFIDLLESMFYFYTKEKLYIWKKEPNVKKETQATPQTGAEGPQVFVPKLSESKLKELAWSLDINENQNPLTGQDGKNTK